MAHVDTSIYTSEWTTQTQKMTKLPHVNVLHFQGYQCVRVVEMGQWNSFFFDWTLFLTTQWLVAATLRHLNDTTPRHYWRATEQLERTKK